MLNVVRGRLFVADLIYAEGQNFLCSTVFTPDQPYAIPVANYTRKPDVAIYYYRDTPFYTGYKMTYMQRGNYVVVVNPLSYSEVMSADHSLSWGLRHGNQCFLFRQPESQCFFIKFDDSG
jgi:sensor c-di-GMP phosphodiesterase-like protein